MLRAPRGPLVVTLGTLVVAAACGGGPKIEPGPRPSGPSCQAPTVVDGVDVVPVNVGDRVDGASDEGVTYGFCMSAGDWLRFSFVQPQTVTQPVVSISRGSVEIAENRFYAFEADPGTQLFAPVDGVYTLALAPLQEGVPGRFLLDVKRPGDGVRVDPDEIAFGEQAWGALAENASARIALPHVGEDGGVIRVAAAVSGFFGNGSTLFPVVDVVDEGDGDAVVARLDFGSGRLIELPVRGAADYALVVSGSGGERPFYALEEVDLAPAPIFEADDAGNGSVLGAESLALDGAIGLKDKTVAVQLALGDVDMFSFHVDAGKVASFSCRAESAGSGARALQVDLRDADGNLLIRAAEGPQEHPFVGGTRTYLDAAAANYRVTGGTYIGSVQATDFDDHVKSRYALCTAAALDD